MELYLPQFPPIFSWGSILLNVVVFALWVKQRMVLDNFLVGHWSGRCHISDHPDVSYEHKLLIVPRHGAKCSAYMAYELYDHETEQAVIRGLDRLENYESDMFFIMNRKWNAKFTSVMHKNYTAEKSYGLSENSSRSEFDNSQASFNKTPSKYDYQCKITHLWRNPQMSIEIRSNGGFFAQGHLTKS